MDPRNRLVVDGTPQPILFLLALAAVSTLGICSLSAAVLASGFKAQAVGRLAAATVPAPAHTPSPTPCPTPTEALPAPAPTAEPSPTPTATPTPTLKPLPAEWLLPQGCGMTDRNADYGAVGVGTVVILGRHRDVEGVDNWSKKMEAYVGRQATVTERAGVDRQGCPGVHVDVDGGKYFWRVRDLTLP